MKMQHYKFEWSVNLNQKKQQDIMYTIWNHARLQISAARRLALVTLKISLVAGC